MAEGSPAANVVGSAKRARRRWAWTALAVLAAVALLLVMPHLRGQRHFDDPLFERYHHLVASQRACVDRGLIIERLARMLHLNPPGGLAAELNVEAIRDWEPEYRDEPKYWELRASTLGCEPEVIEAFRRGVFGEGLLEAASTWEVFDADQTLARNLCDKAIAAAPDNSYWCYRKSDLLFTQGDKQGALALVKQGNAAPRNEHPRPFPLSYVLADHTWVKSSTDKLVAGFSLSGTWVIAFKSHEHYIAKDVRKMMSKGCDPAIGDDYFIRATRRGQMDSCEVYEILKNITIQGMVLAKNGPRPFIELNDEQQKKFEAYSATRRAISYSMKLLHDRKPRHDARRDPLGWETEWERYVAEREDRKRIASYFAKLLPAPHSIWKSGGLTGFKLDPELAALVAEADKERALRKQVP
jgi:hypothetical protein